MSSLSFVPDALGAKFYVAPVVESTEAECPEWVRKGRSSTLPKVAVPVTIAAEWAANGNSTPGSSRSLAGLQPAEMCQ